MFELPTHPSRIGLEIANVLGLILMNRDDNNTDRESSENAGEDLGEYTLSSNIEEDNLDNQHEVILLDQVRRDKTIRTTTVPLPKKRSHADNGIACTSLPNLRHPAGAMALPLLNHQMSTINISCKSDTDQAPLHPQAGADQNVPQQKPGRGEYNSPQHQMATFEVARRFMEAIVFTKTPWTNISDEKYSMVDEAWQLAIQAQDCQRALAGAPVVAPSVCQLPGGPSFKTDPQTREPECVYSVFCSLIGLIIMLIPKKYS
jgi:hypothetical protein